MIETLISSKTRIKLLFKFFINSNTRSHLRGLESEFGESSNAIRLELNKFEKAGMLTTVQEGNKKVFQANKKHPLFGEIHNILLKHIGIDKIIENVIERLGDVESVFLTGEFSVGIDSRIIDLIVVGNIDKAYFMSLTDKAEKIISRKIRYLIYNPEEFEESQILDNEHPPLLLWCKEK